MATLAAIAAILVADKLTAIPPSAFGFIIAIAQKKE
jgi:hypothetical protein